MASDGPLPDGPGSGGRRAPQVALGTFRYLLERRAVRGARSFPSEFTMSRGSDLLRALDRLVETIADASATAPTRAAALRAAVRAARVTGARLSLGDGGIAVDGAAAPGVAIGGNVRGAMERHGLRELHVRPHASARDLAQLAGLLTRPPEGDDAGTALALALDALHVWSVRVFPAERPTDATIAAGLARAFDAADETARVALRAQVVSEPTLTALIDAIASTESSARQSAIAVLRQAGDAAPRALVARMITEASMHERRRCWDALAALETDSVPALVAALEHPAWYAVRNAAELLGDMRASEASVGLRRALLHEDPRVRYSAAVALEKLGTAAARAALQQAVRDDAPEVRRLAAISFVGDAGASPAPLVDAFEREGDGETKLEQLRALGAIGTPATVQCILRALGTQGASQPTEVRLAAIAALVAARGPTALPLLRGLQLDRDPVIRDTARRVSAGLAA
jgi:HEAT repeat protein